MINIIKMILLKLVNLLPDSPFQGIQNVDMSDYDFIYWFLPLDNCANIMLSWLVCMGIYYLFLMIKSLISKFITGIAKTVSIFM